MQNECTNMAWHGTARHGMAWHLQTVRSWSHKASSVKVAVSKLEQLFCCFKALLLHPEWGMDDTKKFPTPWKAQIKKKRKSCLYIIYSADFTKSCSCIAVLLSASCWEPSNKVSTRVHTTSEARAWQAYCMRGNRTDLAALLAAAIGTCNNHTYPHSQSALIVT